MYSKTLLPFALFIFSFFIPLTGQCNEDTIAKLPQDIFNKITLDLCIIDHGNLALCSKNIHAKIKRMKKIQINILQKKCTDYLDQLRKEIILFDGDFFAKEFTSPAFCAHLTFKKLSGLVQNEIGSIQKDEKLALGCKKLLLKILADEIMTVLYDYSYEHSLMVMRRDSDYFDNIFNEKTITNETKKEFNFLLRSKSRILIFDFFKTGKNTDIFGKILPAGKKSYFSYFIRSKMTDFFNKETFRCRQLLPTGEINEKNLFIYLTDYSNALYIMYYNKYIEKVIWKIHHFLQERKNKIYRSKYKTAKEAVRKDRAYKDYFLTKKYLLDPTQTTNAKKEKAKRFHWSNHPNFPKLQSNPRYKDFVLPALDLIDQIILAYDNLE